MERILIKHISGSKANQTDVFLIENNKEIHFGRDPKAEVGFDPERDDLVSRMHARVAQDPADETVFTITDLESRNGTFVNKNKITGTERIYPGDTVQFGVGGPEFQFDVDPRPERLTRLAASHGAAIPRSRREKSTELINTIVASAPQIPSGIPAPRPSVGRATLERMIAQTKGDTRKYLINGAAVLLGIVVLVIGALTYRGKLREEEMKQEINQAAVDVAKKADEKFKALTENKPISAQEIVSAYGASTVFIEASWKLIHTQTGQQIYQRKLPVPGVCELYDERKRCIKPKLAPAYLKLNGAIEPWLVLDDPEGIPIGGQHQGSGFVVQEDGFILTNRHVAATWETRGDLMAGVVYVPNQRGEFEPKAILEDPTSIGWVPSKSMLLGGKPISGKTVEGRHDYLDVNRG